MTKTPDKRSDKTPNHTIVLELNHIRSLFVAPEIDPLSNNELEILGQPGIQRVLFRLKPRSLPKQIRLVLLLPPDQIEPDLTATVRRGIERFCRLKIQDNQTRLKLLRRLWWRRAINGLLFLAVCFALASLLQDDRIPFLSPWLQALLSESLTIVGSVALWHPAETLLYDWIPIVRENDVYRLIQAMDIDILPQS